MSFFDSYRRLRTSAEDDRTACREALRLQREKYREVYESKEELLRREARRNHAFRLRRVKWARQGRRFMTKSGIRVRSKIEKIIADFLWEQGIRFEYEPILDLGGFHVMPDFQLPDFNLCIEHFGLETPAYKASAEAKQKRYERFGIRVICTYPSDEPDIEAVLAKKLRVAGVRTKDAASPNHADAAAS